MKFSLQIGDDTTTWPQESTDDVLVFSFDVKVDGGALDTATWDAETGVVDFGGYSLTLDKAVSYENADGTVDDTMPTEIEGYNVSVTGNKTTIEL